MTIRDSEGKRKPEWTTNMPSGNDGAVSVRSKLDIRDKNGFISVPGGTVCPSSFKSLKGFFASDNKKPTATVATTAQSTATTTTTTSQSTATTTTTQATVASSTATATTTTTSSAATVTPTATVVIPAAVGVATTVSSTSATVTTSSIVSTPSAVVRVNSTVTRAKIQVGISFSDDIDWNNVMFCSSVTIPSYN